ncbi:MAG: hypothetical protein WBD16_04695, partial [Pyrinomonadaceae bacterium]
FFGWGGKKESSSRVSILIRKSLPPSPHGLPDGGSTYAANSMRSAALKSTAKDDDDTNCQPGRPCLPKETVDFKIPLIDMSDTGWIDASQAGDAQFAKDRMKELNDFLNSSRNCARLLYDLAAERLGIIDARDADNPSEIFLSSLNLIDATSSNPDVFNQPLYEGANTTLGRDANENGVAARGSQNGDVHVFDTFFSDKKIDRGFTLFHEILHVFFGTHVDVARGLNLGYKPVPIPPNPKPGTSLQNEMYEQKAEQQNRFANNFNAQFLMDTFIKNDCQR